MPRITEEELRVRELVKDLEIHTGISKDNRPGAGNALRKKNQAASHNRAKQGSKTQLTANIQIGLGQTATDDTDMSYDGTISDLGIFMRRQPTLRDDKSSQMTNPLAPYLSHISDK